VDLVTSPLMGYRAAAIRIANQFQDLELRAASRASTGLGPEDTLARGEGDRGRVHESGEPAFVPRLEEEPALRSRPWTRELGATSVYCLPLRAASRSVGTLSVLSAEENPFPPDERSFLATLAHHLALALENLALYENLEGLRRVSEALLSSGSLDAILRVCWSTPAETIGADPVVLYLYRRDEDRFELPPLVVGEVHDTAALAEAVTVAHAARRLLAAGASVFPGERDQRGDGRLRPPGGIASAARMLLLAGANPWACSSQLPSSRGFTAAGKGLLYSFANEASLAIRTARLVRVENARDRAPGHLRALAPAAILEVDGGAG